MISRFDPRQNRPRFGTVRRDPSTHVKLPGEQNEYGNQIGSGSGVAPTSALDAYQSRNLQNNPLGRNVGGFPVPASHVATSFDAPKPAPLAAISPHFPRPNMADLQLGREHGGAGVGSGTVTGIEDHSYERKAPVYNSVKPVGPGAADVTTPYGTASVRPAGSVNVANFPKPTGTPVFGPQPADLHAGLSGTVPTPGSPSMPVQPSRAAMFTGVNPTPATTPLPVVSPDFPRPNPASSTPATNPFVPSTGDPVGALKSFFGGAKELGGVVGNAATGSYETTPQPNRGVFAGPSVERGEPGLNVTTPEELRRRRGMANR